MSPAGKGELFLHDGYEEKISRRHELIDSSEQARTREYCGEAAIALEWLSAAHGVAERPRQRQACYTEIQT
jgi:hypothetical protein